MVEYEDDRPGWIVFFFIYINMPHPQKTWRHLPKSYYGINEPATDFFPNREPRTARERAETERQENDHGIEAENDPYRSGKLHRNKGEYRQIISYLGDDKPDRQGKNTLP